MENQEQVKKLCNNWKSCFPSYSTLSIRADSSRLHFPPTAVHCILCNCLFLFPYQLQNLQALHNRDKQKRLKFAEHYPTQPEGHSEYLAKLDFFWKMHFHINSLVNKQKVKIGCCTSSWSQHGGHEQFKFYDVVCHIERRGNIPLIFMNQNVTGEIHRNLLVFMHLRASGCCEKTRVFDRMRLLRIIQADEYCAWKQASKQLDWRERTRCLASTLWRSGLCDFYS